MVEAEGFFRFIIKSIEVFTGCFKECVSSHHVGLDEFPGAVNGTVNMAFGGKVHHMGRLKVSKNPVEGGFVADVGFFKTETVGVGNFSQGLQISCVGEFIDNTHTVGGVENNIADNSRADKTGTAGDDDFILFHCSTRSFQDKLPS